MITDTPPTITTRTMATAAMIMTTLTVPTAMTTVIRMATILPTQRTIMRRRFTHTVTATPRARSRGPSLTSRPGR